MSRLSARDLTIRFGGVAAVDGVNLEIAAAEIRGLIGPNGAGKTSFVNLITGVNQPTSGDVLIDGESIRGLKASAVARRGVRRTFQTSQLFRGMTVTENVMVGRHASMRTSALGAAIGLPSVLREEREARARAREALDFVGMSPFAERDGGELSFGQQRMVEIARAIVGEPRLLLLDEPAVGLSLDRVHDLEALILKIRKERGTSILLIEHVTRVVMNVCDRVTVLATGRAIAEGTPAEVVANPAVIEAYLGRQHA